MIDMLNRQTQIENFQLPFLRNFPFSFPASFREWCKPCPESNYCTVSAVSDEATVIQVSINTSTFCKLNHQTGEEQRSWQEPPKDLKKFSWFNNLSHSNPPKMKTFSVAVAVAVVLTFICIQESSAVPVTEVRTRLKLIPFAFYLSVVC